jgi:hypothetical protein
MDQYEEFTAIKDRWAWAIVLGSCVVILLWGYGNYLFIHDRPRQFDYGSLPDAPGQSVYAVTPAPKSQVVPTQLTPLPAASAPAARAPKSSGGGK